MSAYVSDTLGNHLMCVGCFELPCRSGNDSCLVHPERICMVMTMTANRDMWEGEFFFRVLGEDFKGQCSYGTLGPRSSTDTPVMLAIDTNPMNF